MSCKIRTAHCLILLFSGTINSQPQNAPRSEVGGIPVNYDEARVGTYWLPDPLLLANGQPIRDAKNWTQNRCPAIVRLFEENQFGRSVTSAFAVLSKSYHTTLGHFVSEARP